MVFLGILGLIILVSAWLYEMIEEIRKHKILIDLKFAFLYLAGVSLLTAYSFQIRDEVFMWLNSILLVLVASETIYTVYIKKVKK